MVVIMFHLFLKNEEPKCNNSVSLGFENNERNMPDNCPSERVVEYIFFIKSNRNALIKQ